ncbi:MAG: hypothetical protein OSJ83_02075 [Clostridia bacterium]|nr:hypothetical protein [Clostridia bacterium]
MEVIECKNSIRCELGACRNRATHTVKFDHVGLRGRLHACDKCLGELYAAIGKTVVPKSIETAKRKGKGGNA